MLALYTLLFVRLSVWRKLALYRNDWTDRAGFWHRGFLPPILHCVIKRNLGTSKNKGGPTWLWNFVPNSGHRKFSLRQVDLVVNKPRRPLTCWQHLRRSTRRGWTHTVITRPSAVMSSLHYFLLRICFTTCSKSCAAVDKISTLTQHVAQR